LATALGRKARSAPGAAHASLHRDRSSAVNRISVAHYQAAFTPLIYGVALAIVLTLSLKETGPARRASVLAAARQTS
jgi:hypothetical protein